MSMQLTPIGREQLIMERIFLLIKVTLLSGVAIDYKALIDSRSEVNMVPSLLIKQAGWNLLLY
jgi:hypothetical protein